MRQSPYRFFWLVACAMQAILNAQINPMHRPARIAQVAALGML